MIVRVILSAGAMLIFSVSFQIDQMPEGAEQREERGGAAISTWGRVPGNHVGDWLHAKGLRNFEPILHFLG